jgi:hypothetical protein
MQGLLANELRAEARQIALGELLKAFEELRCDRTVEDAVAEKLQALVVESAVTPMSEGLREEFRAAKVVSDGLLKPSPVHGSLRVRI